MRQIMWIEGLRLRLQLKKIITNQSYLCFKKGYKTSLAKGKEDMLLLF
jgi:hypothetical protein